MRPTLQDPQLLLAVLAVQLGFLEPGQVIAAAAAGLAEPESELGARLAREGLITSLQLRMLRGMVDEALRAHEGDAARALGAIGGKESVARTFGTTMEFAESLDLLASLAGSSGEASPAPEARISDEQPGRYSLGEECGRGGQARVLLAMDEHMGRQVAWKQLLPSPGATGAPTHGSTSIARFLREARITGQLEHPNIVPVHELGRRDDGSLYYTMRVVRGESLAKRLEDCSGLEDRLKLLGAFWDCCNAMAFAHSRGVIHRDLKPANVMVGAFGETVVLDWGLAKVQGAEDERSDEIAEQVRQLQDGPASATLAGWAVGTPSYMSPEQADGRLDLVDERSDVWGLGGVLFELLTGRPPYIGNNPYHVVAQVRQDPVPAVLDLCADAPPELVAIATKALHRDRERRYRSAAELAEDVSAYMTDRRVQAYEYSSWELLRRFARRNKAAVGASAAILLTVVVALVLVAGAWQRARLAAEQEHAQRLRTHHVLAQAYGIEADRELLAGRPLRSRIFAAASLVENPANPAGPHHEPGFGTRHPGADRLLVKASSRLYQASFRPVRALEARLSRDDALMDVAFSPDGTLVATAEFAKGFTVHDLTLGSDSWRVPEPATVTYGLSFFPDGQRLVTVGKGPAVQVWRIGQDEPLLVIEHPELHSSTSVAIAPDGTNMATRGGHDGRAVALWDTQDGSLRWLSPGGQERVSGVAYAPDGALIAASAYEEPVRLLDPATGSLVREIPVPNEAYVYWLEFSPRGDRLLTAATDGTVRCWSPDSGELLLTMETHEDYFYYAAFSPDGRRIAAAGAKGSVRIWDAETGGELVALRDHKGAVSAVAFAPDGQTLASAGYDKLLRLWSLEDDRALSRRRSEDTLYRVVYDPTGATMATLSEEGAVRLWSRGADQPPIDLPREISDASGLAFAPDGEQVAVSGGEGAVRVYDVRSGQRVHDLVGHEASAWCVAFSPDGSTLATGSADQTLRLWDLARGELVATATEPDVHVNGVAFSADSSLVAGVGGGPTVWVWSVPDGKLVRTLEGHEDWIHDLAWLPGGHQLVTAGRDGYAILWDADQGTELQRFVGHEQSILALDVHAPSRRLASLGRDGVVISWQIDIAEPELWLLHATYSRDLALSPDGQELAVLSKDEVIGYPLDRPLPVGDPREHLEAAQHDAALKLQGFELTVP